MMSRCSVWLDIETTLLCSGANKLSEILIEIYTFSLKIAFENVVCEMAPILPRLQCVKIGGNLYCVNPSLYTQYVSSLTHRGISLLWRHNGHSSVSNHQPHDCLHNRLFRRRSKLTSKLRVTGLCVGNSPGTGEFPAQMASNAENVSIWWRHHVETFMRQCAGSSLVQVIASHLFWAK